MADEKKKAPDDKDASEAKKAEAEKDAKPEPKADAKPEDAKPEAKKALAKTRPETPKSKGEEDVIAATSTSKKDEEAAPAKDEKRPSSPWPSAHKKQDPPKAPAAAKTSGAPWAAPLDRLDRAWTKLDARLCAGVLVAEALSLVVWLSVDAMSKSGKGGPGMIYRCLLTSVVFTAATYLVARRAKIKQVEIATTVAFFAGVLLGTQWGDLGTVYFANLYGWMQNASILVFFGGIGEIAKKLTFWLALLGASVATGQGKHITVDVVMRVLSPKARVPVAVLGWLVAGLVSISGAWGFFDGVAVEQYHVPTSVPCPGEATKKCPASPGSKIDAVTKLTGRNLFLAGRQLSLDVRTLPRVLGGTPYGKWLTAKEWNEWLRGGDWESRFAKEDVKALELPEDSTDFRQPAVTAVPGGTDRIEQLLSPLLNLVFPFGLLVIGIRFFLRSILAIAGWVKVDPDAAHGDDELKDTHDPTHEAEHLIAEKEAS